MLSTFLRMIVFSALIITIKPATIYHKAPLEVKLRNEKTETDAEALKTAFNLEISNPKGSAKMVKVLRRRRQTTTEQQEFLDAHNEARFSVEPKAANMKKIKWSDDLAQVAQNYAQKCIWAHNPDRTTEAKALTSQFSYVGENLFATSASSIDPKSAVKSWDNEKSSYNITSLSCVGVCGHYTQVVWANSEYVGCASQTCDTFSGLSTSFNGGTIVVCNYGQGGNYNGQQPYMTGAPCTSCPSGYSCSNDLCVRDGDSGGTSTETGDCFEGDGSDYQGSADMTVSGQPCLVWSSVYDFLPGDNYCRNYFSAYGVTEPVCYYQPGSYYVEPCGIPKCGSK